MPGVQGNPATLGDAGLALITEFEGFFPHPYNDPVGYSTVGFGHLIAYRRVNDADRKAVWVEGQHEPGVLTRAEAMLLLRKDMRSYAMPVFNMVQVKISQDQFDALVSFAYNVGTGGLKGSTLLRKLNAGDVSGAADEFLRWNRAGGRVYEGLTRRRKEERALFLRGAKAGPVKHDGLVGYTANEKAWIREYDALLRARRNPARRKELRDLMTAQRKRIWRAAQESGWDAAHRRARYHSLLARTASK
jgi:GH24 family phage-related lysozyme (muramidase)